MKRFWIIAITAMMAVALLSTGCTQEAASDDTTPAEQTAVTSVTDLAGREVEVPETVDRVLAIGPGALRLVVYAGGADKVVGIEDIESTPPVSRPYILANRELLDLPVIGAGGPDSAPDAERILSVEPDAIFVGQLADAAAADELQNATGIPVYVISYGDLGNFDQALFDSITMVGTVMGTSERADEVVTYIQDVIADLTERTADVADSDKPTAFIGALGFKGMHGLESTQGNYPPLAAIGANNVAGSLDQAGSVMIDKEQLIEWDPAYIFVDRSGIGLVLEDVGTNRPLYEGLTAVKDGNVYSQIPFNNYWTNVELALADGYYAGTVLFPEQFSDIDPAAKADEISEAIVGTPVYDQIVEIYGGGFESLDLLTQE